MSQLDTQNIMEAFRTLISAKATERQQSLEQQRMEMEEKLRREALSQEKELRSAELKHQQAILKATQAVQAAQGQATLYEMLQNYQKGGPLPVGAKQEDLNKQWQPVTAPGPAGMVPLPPQGGYNISLPFGDQSFNFKVMDPNQYASRQAELTAIQQKPVLEAQKELERSRQEEETKRQLAVTEKTTAAQKNIAELNRQADLARTRMEVAARIQEAGINAGYIVPPGATYTPTDIVKGSLGRIATGQSTLDEEKKLMANKPGYINQLNNMLTTSKIVPLDPKQKQTLESMAPALHVIPLMNRWNEIFENHKMPEIINPASEVGQELTRLQQQISEGLIVASTQMGTAGRISKDRIQVMQKAFDPSKLNRTPVNRAAANEYRQFVTTFLDGKLYNIPKEQRALILSNIYQTIGGNGAGTTVKMKFPSGEIRDIPVGDVSRAEQMYGGQRQ